MNTNFMNPLLHRFVFNSQNLRPKVEYTQNLLLDIRNKVLYMNKAIPRTVLCPLCELQIKPYWEPTFHNVRASCSICGVNWQEL